ncbi:MAG: YdcF family protein [Rhodospirillales bacterium]|nr:YdcF family protein [Rhodospirillales bacterium]
MVYPRKNARWHQKSWVVRLLIVGVLVVAAWGAGLFRFAALLPTEIDDQTTRTDAIIVLTGGSERLNTGLDLLKDNWAGKLFVSGVYQGVDVNTLLQMFRHNPADLERRIGIGTATSTIGNALETADWIVKEGFTSLRLVTSAYHMPRSLLEFRNVMPGVKLVPHPVFAERVKQDRWWAWPGTASLITGEYNKFLLAWLRHFGKQLFAKTGVR